MINIQGVPDPSLIAVTRVSCATTRVKDVTVLEIVWTGRMKTTAKVISLGGKHK